MDPAQDVVVDVNKANKVIDAKGMVVTAEELVEKKVEAEDLAEAEGPIQAKEPLKKKRRKDDRLASSSSSSTSLRLGQEDDDTKGGEGDEDKEEEEGKREEGNDDDESISSVAKILNKGEFQLSHHYGPQLCYEDDDDHSSLQGKGGSDGEGGELGGDKGKLEDDSNINREGNNQEHQS
jgi:hypothetical protein